MHVSRRLTAVVLAAGLAVSLDRVASAQSLVWANAAGGAASTTTNWSPAQVPTATSDLIFNLGGLYAVTFANTVPTTRTHTYKLGTVTLSMTSPHTATNGITVGDVSGDNATMTLTTGTLTSNAPSIVGDASGSTGILNVNDDDADLIIGNAADLTIGNNGAATLNITGVGHVQVADQFIVGSNSTSVANATVSGFLAVVPFGNSFLEVLGTNDSRIGAGGDATLTVSNGARAAFGGNLIVANGAASTSSITVQNSGLFDARLDVDGNLLLGRNVSAGVAAGNGTLTINNGGAATIGGTCFVGGDPDTGTALLKVATGGSLVAHDLSVGTGGTLQHTGGDVIVDGGVFSQVTAPVVVSDATGTPTLTLRNNATASLTTSAAAGFRIMTIGGPGTAADGLVRILSGAQVSVVATGSALTLIGEDTDDQGELDVDGAGSLFTGGASAAIAVGTSGNGRLEVTNGGKVSIGVLGIASQGSSVSSAFSQDAGSVIEVGSSLYVGGSSGGPGGTGQLFVRSGGLLNVTQTAVSTVIYNQGLISVEDSTLTSAGTISCLGSLAVDDGTIDAVQISADDGAIGGFGFMNARIQLANASVLSVGSNVIPAATGSLTVGDPLSTAGFASSGSSLISVADQCSLTIRDFNAADAEHITLNGGTISALRGIRLLSTANVSGHGLIDADVSFTLGGSITPDSTGLRFGGTLTRSGGTMSGTIFGFNGGGGFNGNGTITGQVDFDAGSACTNTGILTMGAAGHNFGVTMDGQLNVGNGTVTLLDANGIGLGTITDLAGGSLVCAQNLIVNAGRTIEGTGTVQAPLLSLLGSVKPADHPAQPPHRGSLNISGAVSMGVNNTFFCDIDPGIEFPAADRIQSTGVATINGALSVAFIDGYTPAANHLFDIVIGSSRTGIFNSLTTPPVGPFGPVHVEYFPDRARLVFCYANCDGSAISPTLNVNDFQCFLNRFAAADPYANCDQSTIAPVLNVNDFSCFLNKFAAGCS